MSLTRNQVGVLKGILLGLAISISIILVGIFFDIFVIDDVLSETSLLIVAIKWSLLPAAFLVISIARLAKHRFFSPNDIDGGAGLSSDSERAQYLQSLLQNTLEQYVIALTVYLAWAAVMPAKWISVVPLAACTFSVGRVLFFSGFMKGASSRALGFALTFYPTVLMFIMVLVKVGFKG
ncbi:MAPEG family protein [Thiorhodovibrio frisius]|uniref:MAPEG family n=1 Tax=Thiorhodovibrio frisius TaxID=631362 RepID=H8Z2S7_9GAMM|nr:MAPEG family protein [Thiorhodovibrio frisius]EIC21663.1 MAPEG family [Thiorhodovibrio frisius]WPL21632.1 MAPEG family protein [Thiorhodovibrio frisius]